MTLTCDKGFHVETQEICVADSSSPPPPTPTPTPLPPPAPVPTPPPPVTQGWVNFGPVPTIAASPTALGRIICQLQPYNGKIFMGYGDWENTVQPGCDLLAFNPDTKAYEQVGPHVPTDALWSLRVVGSSLYAIVTDPEIGCDPDALIVNQDGTTRMLMGSSTPYPWHLFDAVSFRGSTYMSGAYRTQTKDGIANQDWATVWKEVPQAVGDARWIGAYQNKAVSRAYALFVLNGKLWVTLANGALLSSADGVTWTAATFTVSTTVTKPLITPATSSGNKVYYRNYWPALGAGSLFSFNGVTQTPLGNVQDHFLDASGSLWTLGIDGKVTHNLGSTNVSVVTPALANARSLCIDKGVIYVGTSDSCLWGFVL